MERKKAQSSPIMDPVIVGITCSTERPRAYYEKFVRAVAASGGDPLLLPIGRGASPALPEAVAGIDGLLLPGGWDVDPALYGEERSHGVGPADPALDRGEVLLVRAAVGRGVPVFGICRGQQLINVALGGTLHQHLPSHDMHGLDRDYLAHEIEVDPDSELGRAARGRPVEVNSLHHQAIKNLGAGLRVTGRSPDGIIEAVESEGAGVVAVQCHPEELIEDNEWALRLLGRFVERARAAKVARC